MRRKIKVGHLGLVVLALLLFRVTDKDRQRPLSGRDVGPHPILLEASDVALSAAKREGSAPAAAALRIVRWGARSTAAGKPFNRQPSGRSTLWFETTNASSTTKVIFGGKSLAITFGGKHSVSAAVPIEEVQTPGEKEVFLRDAATGVVSNSVSFIVKPQS